MKEKSNQELKWAVLGCGWIANDMAAMFNEMGRSFYAVANRTYEKAVLFAEKYGIEKVYKNTDDLFSDPEIDVVYIATPHNKHYPYMKKALENGKHILVEKAITLNSRELDEMIALATRKGLVIAEAMTIYHMPLYKKMWEIVQGGSLGKVQMITANFGSYKEYDMKNRFFSLETAGGALLDIGVYALSAVRGFLSKVPDRVLSQVKLSEAGSDEQSMILLSNDANELASISISLHSKQPKQFIVSCEKAYIEIMEYPRGDKAVIVDAATGKKEEIVCGDTKKALWYEVEDMEIAVLREDSENMRLGFTKDVMDIMTDLRKEWDMKYPGEEW